MGPKLQIWRFTQFDFSSSNPQKIIILGDENTSTVFKLLIVLLKKVSLSVSHQSTGF